MCKNLAVPPPRQDISDEFKEVIESIKGDGDKCRCVLNKATVYVNRGDPGSLLLSNKQVTCADEIREHFRALILS